jgi:hypothetical protein
MMSESMPWWGWVALVALIPIGLVAPVAFAVLVTKAEKRLAPYFSLLANIEGRQKKAAREGRKMSALGWKFIWVLIFSPIGLLIVWWLTSLSDY